MRGETNIFFNGQYWIGIFSEEKNGEIVRVGKFIFGGEPTLAFLDEWLAKGAPGLFMLPVCHTIEISKKCTDIKNPKRALRQVRKAMRKNPITKETAPQKAVRETFEQLKKDLKKKRSNRNRECQREKFLLKQAKKRAKQKGR